MPTTIVHKYFFEDVLDKTSDGVRHQMDTNFMPIAALGPDHFLFSPWLYRKSRALLRLLQSTHTADYIINMATFIKEHKLMNNNQVMTYFYGTVSHMILDATTHPYIIYKTGRFDKQKKKKTVKYNGLHSDLETFLDCYFIYTRENILPHEKKIYKVLDYKKEYTNDFINFIDKALFNTYGVNKGFKNYYHAIRGNYWYSRNYRNDPWKIKLPILKFYDKLTGKYHTNTQGYTYSMPFKNKYHYLNLEKKEWQHPVLAHKYYNTSFIELYIKAMDQTVKLIKDLEIYFNSKKDVRYLRKIVPNVSYYTGLDLSEKQTLKYFDF